MNLSQLKGLFLLLPTLIACIAANSPFSAHYLEFIHFELFSQFSLHHFVNEALMALFFFLMGLEIKSEFSSGTLSTPKQAALPMIAAAGGCVAPALIYLGFNHASSARAGWAIPMATDIAFAVGVLSLFDARVPRSLKTFLMALAVVDDLIAVAVIALFYGKDISKDWLGFSVCVFAVISAAKYFKIKNVWVYVALGLLAWFCVYLSGIHATVAGVILGLMTPMKASEMKISPVSFLIHKLEPVIAFFVMPVFAFFNSGVDLRGLNGLGALIEPVSLGVFMGLVIGKPMGVIGFSYLSVKLNIAKKIEGVSWKQFSGLGFFAGIGFTMALFIEDLSFQDDHLKTLAKAAIFSASILSALLGAVYLKFVFKRT